MATETWVINETPDLSSTDFAYSVTFTSNSTEFFRFTCRAIDVSLEYQEHGVVGFVEAAHAVRPPIDMNIIWTDEAYRTITLDEPATGNFLIWLEANAVKQEVTHTIGTVDITALESALAASADAIREKSESTELIDFDMEGGTGFAEAIEAIPSGGPQGEYNIIPILKEDGTQRLQITDSGSFSLKVKTITQNGSYDPTDEDVNGYSSVTVAIPTYDGTVV